MNPSVATQMKMKHVKGSLYASNKEAAKNPFIRHRLYYAFKENSLHELVVSTSTWSDNHIMIDSSSPTSGTLAEALQLLNSLNAVMKTEDAQILDFSGRFSLVFESKEEPLVFRVEIKNGKVSYRQAEYVWPESVTLD